MLHHPIITQAYSQSYNQSYIILQLTKHTVKATTNPTTMHITSVSSVRYYHKTTVKLDSRYQNKYFNYVICTGPFASYRYPFLFSYYTIHLFITTFLEGNIQHNSETFTDYTILIRCWLSTRH